MPLILLVAAMMVCLLPLASHTALAISTVHGNVYEWSSFNTLNNAQVVVDTVPQQVMVSKNGSYSFDLSRGTYTIIAKSGTNTSDELFARENVTIQQDNGDYVIDLILFPTSDFEDLSLLDENTTPMISIEPADENSSADGSSPRSNTGIVLLLILGAVGVAAIIIILLYLRKRKKPVPAEKNIPEQATVTPSEPAGEPEQEKEISLPPLPPSVSTDVTLPDDLREVIRIIEKKGGRTTQLDLRKALPYSEAKVSLMITDLENRGIVKKIKKGRGNVIILNRPGVNGDGEQKERKEE